MKIDFKDPAAKIECNRVTWYSKTLAVLLFVALVCGAFFFGVWYEKQQASFLETSQIEIN